MLETAGDGKVKLKQAEKEISHVDRLENILFKERQELAGQLQSDAKSFTAEDRDGQARSVWREALMERRQKASPQANNEA